MMLVEVLQKVWAASGGQCGRCLAARSPDPNTVVHGLVANRWSHPRGK
ncbi:hypothetical protein I546_0689 [Mycobacterium kansasii 732]|nr:hypothetical protein I546_0689 [Mycobacterium kansasii 732]